MSGNWQTDIGRQFASMLSYQRFTPAMMEASKAVDHGVPAPGPRKRIVGGQRYELAAPGEVAVADLGEVLAENGNGASRQKPCLGTLLGYAAGLARLEIEHEWRWHRSVASARCLYPSEVYVSVHGGEAEGLDAGLYHYDPHDHVLARVSDAGTVARIDEAFGIGDESGALLLVSSLIGRTAYIYGDFAYRLCCHEAGMLMQNLCMSAYSLGFEAAPRWFWESPKLEKALPIDPVQELIMGAVRLSPGVFTGVSGATGSISCRTSLPAGFEEEGLSPEWFIQAMRFHQAQLLDRGDLESLQKHLGNGADSGSCVEASAGSVLGGDVRHFWRTRRSGDDPLLSGLRAHLDPETPRVLDQAVSAFCARRVHAGFNLGKQVSMRMLVPDAAGGWQVFASGGRDPVRTGTTPENWRLQSSYAQWNVNLDNAAMCCVLIADYEAGFARFGNAAYRVLNGWAGCLAQLITAVLDARGLVVRCLDGLVETELDRALDLHESEQVMFLLPAFGASCHGRRFSVPYF